MPQLDSLGTVQLAVTYLNAVAFPFADQNDG
jgi:hypothetical protein